MPGRRGKLSVPTHGILVNDRLDCQEKESLDPRRRKAVQDMRGLLEINRIKTVDAR